MYQAGIDPLIYMHSIPANFLFESDIEDIEYFTIPDTITEIQPYAFANCKNLISIKFPTSIKIIHEGVLKDCDRLQSIYFAGTKAEWAMVDCAVYWYTMKADDKYVIHCSDGDLEETERSHGQRFIQRYKI